MHLFYILAIGDSEHVVLGRTDGIGNSTSDKPGSTDLSHHGDSKLVLNPKDMIAGVHLWGSHRYTVSAIGWMSFLEKYSVESHGAVEACRKSHCWTEEGKGP